MNNRDHTWLAKLVECDIGTTSMFARTILDLAAEVADLKELVRKLEEKRDDVH